ncbi:hypothetical protein CCMA1212_002918 [Trichoderma ghanense]|uniref:Major facilitator superfamily (MFS) profile domain-containing protein n=1 Tax=Trichoderma ghanense TaxID=65468 RepID=A0ABY2HEC4_9HYPO
MCKTGSELKAKNNTSWIATAHFLTLTSFRPLYGKLSDIFGHKACLLFAYAVFDVVYAPGMSMIGFLGALTLILAVVPFLTGFDSSPNLGWCNRITIVSLSLTPILSVEMKITPPGTSSSAATCCPATSQTCVAKALVAILADAATQDSAVAVAVACVPLPLPQLPRRRVGISYRIAIMGSLVPSLCFGLVSFVATFWVKEKPPRR